MNWKKYIFENEHETLFETDDAKEMRDYINEMNDEFIFFGVYESANYFTIQFVGYNLMIRK